MRVFKAIGVLLLYPSDELIASLPEIRGVISDADARQLTDQVRKGLMDLVEHLASENLLDLQGRYVELFDQTRSLSLFLFEHNFGDARERGEAMVELRKLYAEHGLEPTKTELPDYLPMLCEFLSVASPTVGATLLADTAALLSTLRSGLAQRKSAYAAAFEALLALADIETDSRGASEFPSQSTSVAPPSMDEVDRNWEEPPVAFGAAPQASRLVPPETLLRRRPLPTKAESS